MQGQDLFLRQVAVEGQLLEQFVGDICFGAANHLIDGCGALFSESPHRFEYVSLAVVALLMTGGIWVTSRSAISRLTKLVTTGVDQG